MPLKKGLKEKNRTRRVFMDSLALKRNELLLGREAVERLAQTQIILFGVGGVGSWCAEALVRSGIGELTLVDPDLVCPTNLNRQLQATVSNLERPKVEALRDRLLEVNPDAQITPLQKEYNLETSTSFDLSRYHYVIDAIDSLSHKTALIAQAMEAKTSLFSAMGAARKLDPSRICVDSIWKTKGCALARFVRKRLRRRGVDGDCQCVYSEEVLDNSLTEEALGSVVHMTGTFGFFLAGLVIQDVWKKSTRYLNKK
jgi:tRNA A37 threonylcarbamoyladenosine dehydratase